MELGEGLRLTLEATRDAQRQSPARTTDRRVGGRHGRLHRRAGGRSSPASPARTARILAELLLVQGLRRHRPRARRRRPRARRAPRRGAVHAARRPAASGQPARRGRARAAHRDLPPGGAVVRAGLLGAPRRERHGDRRGDGDAARRRPRRRPGRPGVRRRLGRDVRRGPREPAERGHPMPAAHAVRDRQARPRTSSSAPCAITTACTPPRGSPSTTSPSGARSNFVTRKITRAARRWVSGSPTRSCSVISRRSATGRSPATSCAARG